MKIKKFFKFLRWHFFDRYFFIYSLLDILIMGYWIVFTVARGINWWSLTPLAYLALTTTLGLLWVKNNIKLAK